MKLSEIILRDMEPKLWNEGEKIPWHDPLFSQRMLKEHLSQKHDAASRRTPIIKKHVDWIHNIVLEGNPSHIIDLGCGPGLYAARLSALGHVCHGIDFSPASIEYAIKHAPENCSYTLGNICETDYGSGYDLVMLIFGEFNVFKPTDAKLILQKAYNSLKSGGKLLLEVSTFDAVYERGYQPATWYSSEGGFFSDKPYLCLMESFWDEDLSVATERYYIVDADTGAVTRYVVDTQAYEEDDLIKMLMQEGFQTPVFYPSLGNQSAEMSELQVMVAIRE